MRVKFALRVGGMMCQNSCAATVKCALLSVVDNFDNYQTSIEVSCANSCAIIMLDKNEGEYSGDFPSIQQACIDAVNDVGFEAQLMVNTSADMQFSIEGMMCQKNCAQTVLNIIQSVSGVVWADVSFATKLAKVWGKKIDAKEIIESVEDVGFCAFLLGESDNNNEDFEIGDNNNLLDVSLDYNSANQLKNDNCDKAKQLPKALYNHGDVHVAYIDFYICHMIQGG